MSKIRLTIFAVYAITLLTLSQDWTPEEINSNSIDSKAIESEVSSTKEEVFEFQKSINLVFDFSDQEVNHSFNGFVYFDWQEDKVATVSLSMAGIEQDIFIKAHFTDAFTLSCLELPKNASESESDSITLLKQLILDYSFKSNRDDNGDYLAQINFKNTPGEAIKVKSKYLDNEKLNLKVTKSRHEYKIEDKLIEAKGEEELKIQLNDKAAEAKTKYQLKASSAANVKRPQLNMQRELGECTNDFSQTSNVTAHLSQTEFSNKLSQISSMDRGSRQDTARKMLKALRAHPEFLANFKDWFHSVKEDRQMAALGVGILGNLGTPEAQKELVELFSNSTAKDKHVKDLVLNAFTLTEKPLTTKSRNFLKNQMKESTSNHSEGAAYALGSSIQNDPESPDSKHDMNYLISALEETETAKGKMIYLDALGNSGNSETFAVFQKYATSNDELIREKAIMGLRFIDHEEKDSMLRIALNDQSARVRQAALGIMNQ